MEGCHGCHILSPDGLMNGSWKLGGGGAPKEQDPGTMEDIMKPGCFFFWSVVIHSLLY